MFCDYPSPTPFFRSDEASRTLRQSRRTSVVKCFYLSAIIDPLWIIISKRNIAFEKFILLRKRKLHSVGLISHVNIVLHNCVLIRLSMNNIKRNFVWYFINYHFRPLTVVCLSGFEKQLFGLFKHLMLKLSVKIVHQMDILVVSFLRVPVKDFHRIQQRKKNC